MARAVALLALVLALGGSVGPAVLAPVHAQAPAPDPAETLLRRAEAALTRGSQPDFQALFASTVAPTLVQGYVADLFVPQLVRATVRERDRAPLEGAPPGDGFSLVVEFFVETAGKGKILTAGVDIRRPPGGDIDSWRIVHADGLSSVEGLYKLRLDTAAAFTTADFQVRAEDLVLTLQDGVVVPVVCDDGVTGFVLAGRGEMRFSPAPQSEKGQLRLYTGSDTMVTAFETVYLRINPAEYRRLTAATRLPGAPQPRLIRRAQDVFARESAKSFVLDLQDLSRDTWHLLPPGDDFLAEVDTRRHDRLTYSRAGVQAEDISLFHREDRRTIALYASAAKLAARGRFYTDDVLRDYDVTDYNVDVSIVPERRSIEGRARLAIRVRAFAVSSVMLRLADDLVVTGVTSVEYGRLLYLRVRGQNALLINLPRTVPQDADLTLVVTYVGRLPSQDPDIDTIAVAPESQEQPPFSGVHEPYFLLSNRSFWYPQNPIPDYATATVRVTVPPGYRAVASGEPVSGDAVVSLRDILTQPAGTPFTFRANQPLRYLAVVVTRLSRVAETTVVLDGEAANAGVDRIVVAVEAHPRQQARGRALLKPTEDILRFYTGLVGEAPFASATIALVESDLPGGHSPGYFALLNAPPDTAAPSYRSDPASFDSFPEFFLAHELAHQWWGQAVGWKNYHEQWLSEGFSQYFAALYAQKVRGDRVFGDMLRQFRRWSLSDSDQGPVYLGYRLGHVKAETRVFRALVYNKGAAVLHMLRRLLGDEVFFRGLRRFYVDRRYQKAGTDDFERAMETESGQVLDRFFERWIYGVALPRIRHRHTVTDGAVSVRFEQLGDLVFDVPVTVSITYADGRLKEVVVPVTDKVVEQTIPVDGAVRQVQVNRDQTAVAEFED